MLGLVAQLVSSLSFGISNVIWKAPLERAPQIVIIFWRTIITCVLFSLLLAFSQQSVFDFKMTMAAWALSSLSFGGLFFFTKALKYENAGIVSTITSFSYLVGVITSVIILGETINSAHALSLCLFVLSTALLSHVKGKFKLTKGIAFAFIAALIWGTTLTLMSIPSKAIGFIQSSFITEISVVLICALVVFSKRGKLVLLKPLEAELKSILFLAGLTFIGLISMYFAFGKIEAYKVVLASSLTHLVSIIFSRIINKEQITPRLISAGILSSLGILIFAFDELG